MDPQITELGLEDAFAFRCGPQVECFNACCRDLNQFLTPYDIIRLKQHLRITSQEFLKRYTQEHSGPETGLPIISLKPDNARDGICPFVTPQGCRVYTGRPSSCRTYPLMRMVSRNRESGQMLERFFMLQEPHCAGFKTDHTQTVSDWITNQDVAQYNQANDLMMDIIACKNRLRPGPLDMKARFMFHTALYNLDHFKTHVLNAAPSKNVIDDAALLAAAESDDLALLKVGMQWVTRHLFGVHP